MVWLDNSRIFAVGAVILLHVSAAVVLGHDVGTDMWWTGHVYDSMVRWCVPLFVMVSGALLLDPGKSESLSTFYRKRLSRVLVPIVFWSVVFLAWASMKRALKGEEIVVADLAAKVLAGNPHYHMWFLYMILGLYLFTPFFRMVVARSSRRELVWLTAITFALSAFNFAHSDFSPGGSRFFVNWFLPYVPFFFLGHLVRHDTHERSAAALWTIFFLSFALTLVGSYTLALKTNLETGLYFYGYLSVSVIPMSTSVIYLLKRWQRPLHSAEFAKKLSALTLGIYLFHPILLEILNHQHLGAMDFHPAISIPVVSVAVFGVSVVVAWALSHIPYLRRTI